MRSEILQQLKGKKTKLDLLGPKRQTYAEQNQFLMEIAMRFQSIAESAVKSNYSREKFLHESQVFRLATISVNRGEDFARNVEQYGHKYAFDGDNVQPSTPNINSRTTFELDIVDEIFSPNRVISKAADGETLSWLKDLYYRSRGFEIGVFDASVLSMAMKEQAESWEDLALGYISDIISTVHFFIVGVLQFIVPDDRPRQAIINILMDDLIQRYEVAIKHTKFILSVELEGNPATYNHYFNENLTK